MSPQEQQDALRPSRSRESADAHLPGVGAGVDAQEARVLVAVVVGSGVVHPVVPVGTPGRWHGAQPCRLGPLALGTRAGPAHLLSTLR